MTLYSSYAAPIILLLPIPPIAQKDTVDRNLLQQLIWNL